MTSTETAVLATALFLTLANASSAAESVAITPASPTHLFYTPTPNVNPPYCLIVSLHEISFSFPGRLQLQASLLDNIGRINFGAKWEAFPDFSLGAGLAHTFAHLGWGKHGIPTWAAPRVGAFLACGLIDRQRFLLSLTPHTQIGDRFSMGLDMGLMATPHPLWSIIGEVGTSVDFSDPDPNRRLYLNSDVGLRIHPPSIPFLSFDAGVDLSEFAVMEDATSAGIFVDVIFGMVAK